MVVSIGWASNAFPGWLRLGVGAPLLVSGVGSLLWSVRVLSVHASLGLRGQLVRVGPYRHSRNPQYVSLLAILAGWALLSASSPALWACFGAGAWYFLAAFVEEPWLRAQFGAEYDAYARTTPRFIAVGRRQAAT